MAAKKSPKKPKPPTAAAKAAAAAAAAKKTNKAPSGDRLNTYAIRLAAFAVLFYFIQKYYGLESPDLDRRLLSIDEIKANALKAPCADKENADRCAELAKNHGCSGSPGWMSVSKSTFVN